MCDHIYLYMCIVNIIYIVLTIYTIYMLYLLYSIYIVYIILTMHKALSKVHRICLRIEISPPHFLLNNQRVIFKVKCLRKRLTILI